MQYPFRISKQDWATSFFFAFTKSILFSGNLYYYKNSGSIFNIVRQWLHFGINQWIQSRVKIIISKNKQICSIFNNTMLYLEDMIIRIYCHLISMSLLKLYLLFKIRLKASLHLSLYTCTECCRISICMFSCTCLFSVFPQP